MSVFIFTNQIFFPKKASVNVTKNGFGVVFPLFIYATYFSPVEQVCFGLAARRYIFLKKNSDLRKIIGYVCPVSTVSVIQLIKGQGILNNLPVDCVYLRM